MENVKVGGQGKLIINVVVNTELQAKEVVKMLLEAGTDVKAVDEDGAAEDFEQFGDGPVVRTEAGDREADPEAPPEREEELAVESCSSAFSPCRQDSDCCGASVCRSRPGTISGHFECTLD